MNLDELTPEQRVSIERVLREAPADASLDAARPSPLAFQQAFALAGDTLPMRELRRLANGLVRAHLVVA
jgi:hypothetical protein